MVKLLEHTISVLMVAFCPLLSKVNYETKEQK